MLRQIAFGGGVGLINIAIHAFTMTTLVMVSQFAYARAVSSFHASMLFVLVMVPTVLVLMIVHFFEVSIWALAYFLVDACACRGRSTGFCLRELHHVGLW
jgi:hypothetical protein